MILADREAGAASMAAAANATGTAWTESSNARRAMLRDMVAAQGGRCHWCGWPVLMGTRARRRRDPKAATVDHVLALSRGGTDARENLCASCADCNHDKGSMTVAEWLESTRGGLFPHGPAKEGGR